MAPDDASARPVGARDWGIAAACVFALMVLWHGPLLWGTEVLCGGDQVNYFNAIRGAQVRGGWFAGWQPCTFAGFPIVDNIQTGALYPPNWLFLCGISVERTATLLALGHLFLGAMGLFGLAAGRQSRNAAIVAAAVWTFGGYQLLRIATGVLVFVQAFAWLPWMLWAAERQSLRAGRRWAGLLALFGGLQLANGAPQPVQIAWVGIAAWTLFRAWRPEPGESRGSIAGGFAAAGFLALLMNAPVLTAAIRFQGEAFARGGADPWAYLIDGSMNLRNVLTWFIPELFAPATREELYWASSVGFSETNAACGIAAFMLAAFGAICAVRGGDAAQQRWLAALATLSVFGILVGFGGNGFLFRILVDWVPTFGMFRVPARWIVWFAMAVALMAGFGWDALQRVDARWKLWLPTAALPAAFAALSIAQGPALDRLGIGGALQYVAPQDAEAHLAALRAFASSATSWALMMAAGTFALGLAAASGRFSKPAAMALLALLLVADLRRFWVPFAQPIPPDAAPREISSESPFHRIAADRYRAYFFPESEPVAFLQAAAKDGRVHYTDMLASWHFDQNQRELLCERPLAFGLEVTRGYQQLHLATYVEDFYSSIAPPPNGIPGAFLQHVETRDRRFFDAYNVRVLLSYDPAQLPGVEDPARFGFAEPRRLNAEGLTAWKNPAARGWAWLSASDSFLDAEPAPQLGTVALEERSASLWRGTATLSAPAVLHLSSPDYSGWTISAVHADGTEAEALSTRSIRLEKPGAWTFERRFSTLMLKPSNLLLALMAIGAALALALLPRRQSEALHQP